MIFKIHLKILKTDQKRTSYFRNKFLFYKTLDNSFQEPSLKTIFENSYPSNKILISYKTGNVNQQNRQTHIYL